MGASTAEYLDRLKDIVETMQGYNDTSDKDMIVQEAVKSHFQMKAAVELSLFNDKLERRRTASASAKEGMSLLDEYGLMASQTDKSRSRLTDVGGPAGTGTPRKIIGEGGLIDTNKYPNAKYFEFSLSRGGGYFFDGRRRRKDADNYLTSHEAQITQLVNTVNKVDDAKWALGKDSSSVEELRSKVLAERNHIVKSRNQLTKVDTYAKADGYNPIGNAIMRSGEVKILDRYDSLIEQYDAALNVIESD
tara:strand:- start:739 stop:1482 length:744 start_codon:yes stop_codon:yes gene_type:complete